MHGLDNDAASRSREFIASRFGGALYRLLRPGLNRVGATS
jgi:hypothetical protein